MKRWCECNLSLISDIACQQRYSKVRYRGYRIGGAGRNRHTKVESISVPPYARGFHVEKTDLNFSGVKQPVTPPRPAEPTHGLVTGTMAGRRGGDTFSSRWNLPQPAICINNRWLLILQCDSTAIVVVASMAGTCYYASPRSWSTL